jgi:hypothetical protein
LNSRIAGKAQIARYKGTVQTFGAIHVYFTALQELGFSPRHILRMASQASAATAIEAVAQDGRALLQKSFPLIRSHRSHAESTGDGILK